MKRKNDFYSWMEKLANKKAQDWTKVPMKPLDPLLVETQMLNDPTYNYETFYNLQPFMAERMLWADPDAHFTDIGKTMYHPTFSDESAFSGYVNDFNPLGIIGGHWNEGSTEYTPSESQLQNYWNYNRTRDYLDHAEDHPVRINIPTYKPGKDDEETLDQKAARERKFQQEHPFVANVVKNAKEIKQGWDNFWDHNLYRYPVMVASGGVVGAGLQKLARMKKAVDLIKLRKETAHLKPPYRDMVREVGLEPHDELINTAIDAYSRFQQTPIGALLPFNKGKNGKNTMSSFITDIGPLVYQGLKSRDVQNIDNAYNYIMRQLAMESGYGESKYRNSHNYGGVMSKDKLKQFESDQQFVDYYLNLMNSKYRDAVSAKDLRQYAEQLGKQGYYNGPTVQQYYDKLNGLKTYGRLLQNDFDKNRSIYEQNSGIQPNPETNEPEFVQPVLKEQQPIEVPYLDPQKLGTLTFPVNQPMMNMHTVLPQLKPMSYPNLEQNESFDHGKSGIHINPANRGKFNATKKRTGKTTEELTHSKNPLTRKRAIFALNASKWNKK